jgi:sugar phosphate isomerase/epimerase
MFKFIDDFFKKIIHAHINDNFGLEDGTGFKTPKYGDLHLPLGMGTLPLEKIIKKLKKSGYGGIWMLEIKPLRVTDDERKVWKLIEDSYKKLKAKV